MPAEAWCSRPGQWASFAFFFFAYYAYVGVFSPYVSLFFADRGIAAAEVGVLMSLTSVTRIFGPNLWGWVADHSQRRVVVLRIATSAALLVFVGMFWGRSFFQFFLVMLLLSACTSAQGPLSEAIMLAEMGGDLTHYGRLRLWGSVGFIVAVTGAGELLDRLGMRFMPWICWSLLALLLLAGLRMREPALHGEQHARPSVRALLRRREVAAFFASTFMMVAAHSALYVFYSLYLAQLGYSKTVIGLMWSLGVLAEIVFFYYQARLFRKFGAKTLMLASLGIAVFRFLMIGLGAQSLPWLLLAQIMHAATFAAHHSASVTTMQRWFAGPLQARGQALYISISYGGGGLAGGLAMSAFWNMSWGGVQGRGVFFVAAALALAGLIAAMLSWHWITATVDRKVQ